MSDRKESAHVVLFNSLILHYICQQTTNLPVGVDKCRLLHEQIMRAV